MNVQTGIDIIEVDRIQKAIEGQGEKFLNHVYTEKEIEYCESKKQQKYQRVFFVGHEKISVTYEICTGDYR